MTNWLRVVTIHGGLVLAGVLLFHAWLNMPSGQGLPSSFRVHAGMQALLLLLGGWVYVIEEHVVTEAGGLSKGSQNEGEFGPQGFAKLVNCLAEGITARINKAS